MAFTVEDGSGVADANGYIDLAFADEHHADRGHDAWAALSDDEKQKTIVRATDYVDKRFGTSFRGTRSSKSQGLEWPRMNAVDDDGFLLSGSEEVPRLLKKAVAEYALRAAVYNILAPDPIRSVPAQDFDSVTQSRSTSQAGAVKSKRTKAGPVETETEFQTPAEAASKAAGARGLQSGLLNDFYIPEYPEADLWIEELLRSSHGVTVLGRGD